MNDHEPAAAVGTVLCHECGQRHRAEYSHRSQWGNRAVYAVVCPADGLNLTDYYTDEVVEFGGTCEWFALCENGADGIVTHPILGPVPTCKRCADQAEQSLAPWGEVFR